MTTFWGPNGRYRWCRLPFGLSSAPEEFQRRLQNALHGIEGVAVVADDILVFGVGTTMEDAIQNHDEALLRVLKRGPPLQFEAEQTKAATSLARIVIHRTQDFGVRCALGPSQSNGYQPMPAPTSAPEVRRFLGMCNYLSRFIPKLSQVSEPLRALTESNKDFVWGKVEQEHFEQIKALISKDQLLHFYNVKKPTTIQCDASTKGLGATLLQEGHPIISVSRSLTRAEKNYVVLELECLTIVFACQRFHHYIYGKHTLVETDHKPLEVITKKSILAAPRRLQRMLLQLQRYDLEIWRSSTDQESSSGSQTSCLVNLLSRLAQKISAGRRFFTPSMGNWKRKSLARWMKQTMFM